MCRNLSRVHRLAEQIAARDLGDIDDETSWPTAC
jgi:hypothetical protein